MKVLVTRSLPGDALDRLNAEHEVDLWTENHPPSPDQLRERAVGCAGLLTLLSDQVDGALMDAAGEQLCVISNYAVGFNNIDLDQARRRGIRVGNTPDVLTPATADMAVTLLLAATRRLKPAVKSVVEGTWRTWQPAAFLGGELSEKTLGIVGMGRIGLGTAARLVGGWSMKLLYTSRRDHPEANELGGCRVGLEELLSNSDYVSLHVPLTAETRHMIDSKALTSMSPSATLVNTARGEIIDQDALLEHCQQHPDFTVGLDVTTPEPIAADHPLVHCDNVLITPHIGSATRTAREAMADLAVDNLLAGLGGQPLPHAVA